MKHIVILGGGFGGVTVAHRILKQVGNTVPIKITMVSPNSHFYWSLASPRALIPGQLEDSKVFLPIAEGFTQYPAGQFEFILGTAEGLDVEAKTVRISATGKTKLEYDYLILATGSHVKGDVPFKDLGSTEMTKDALHDFQARIKQAETIVVAGAGATGVELCGELAFEFGDQKEIILIAGSPTVLAETIPSVSKVATKALEDMKVSIKPSVHVESSTVLPDDRIQLSLSDGEKLTTDLYIPAFGLYPNSSYVPSKFLNERGFVRVDQYFAVKGTTDVYAFGDICDVEPLQFIYVDRQSTFLAKMFTLILSNKPTYPYKVMPLRIMGVSIGRQLSTGHWGSFKMPGFLAFMIRKNLFLQNFESTVNGTTGGSLF